MISGSGPVMKLGTGTQTIVGTKKRGDATTRSTVTLQMGAEPKSNAGSTTSSLRIGNHAQLI